MRGAFGVNNCGVLPINSGSPDAAIPTADVWTGHLMLPIAPKPQEAPLVSIYVLVVKEWLAFNIEQLMLYVWGFVMLGCQRLLLKASCAEEVTLLPFL